jgi:hypothetical protein
METLITGMQEFIALLVTLTLIILLLAIKLGWQIVRIFCEAPKLHLGARGAARDLRKYPTGPHRSGVTGDVQSL